ncbi:hypothetical protein BV898_04871 [Hypsibius exemplaris]|uniref:F-box domain-containing protein n=1 Tax=Hypsibius exemplaris TaxID=2072580 RepID=A0A1W0X0T2_HYPEX|nr:hypothetical protein BV898_04871 [Hypsibius exemplaris]
MYDACKRPEAWKMDRGEKRTAPTSSTSKESTSTSSTSKESTSTSSPAVSSEESDAKRKKVTDSHSRELDGKVDRYVALRDGMKQLREFLNAKETESEIVLEEIQQVRKLAAAESAGDGGTGLMVTLRRVYDQLLDDVQQQSALLLNQKNTLPVKAFLISLRCAIGEMPGEVLVMLFHSLDFLQRNRMRRVCKRWNHLLVSAEVNREQTNLLPTHVWVDTETFLGNQTMICPFPPRRKPRIAAWNAVQTLTLNGHCKELQLLPQSVTSRGRRASKIIHHGSIIRCMAQRLPQLSHIKLINIVMPAFPDFKG